MISKKKKKNLISMKQSAIGLAFVVVAVFFQVGKTKKMTLQSDFYREVEDNGYRYQVYHPIDSNEELI
jgi:hypothetical protein